MPIYTYEVIGEDGNAVETFEVLQNVSDPPLEKHPETGQSVRRIFMPPNISGQHSESATKSRLSDKNLDRLGFTKYQRVGKGYYERRAGSKGPKQITPD